MKVPLYRLAHARSGDKGNGSNVGLIAYDQACYELIRKAVTPATVKKHFGAIVKGKVVRFEAPNLLAFNFILHNSLGGGGSTSLLTDAQGKTHGMGLLLMEMDVPPSFKFPKVGTGGALSPGMRRGPAKKPAAARTTTKKPPARRPAAKKKVVRKKVVKKITRKK